MINSIRGSRNNFSCGFFLVYFVVGETNSNFYFCKKFKKAE